MICDFYFLALICCGRIDGFLGEEREVCGFRIRGYIVSWLKGGIVLSNGEWRGKDSRVRGEYGVKGKVFFK